MTFSGQLLYIHVADAAGMAMQEVKKAQLIAGVGVDGDRYASGTGHYSKKPDIREVTLIEVETLEALRRDHAITLLPEEHRRNLTTRDVPLNHLVGRQFAVGETILEGGRLNTPCAYLEKLLDKRVYKLLMHRSGLNCRIIKGGAIRPGDPITPLPAPDRHASATLDEARSHP